MQLREASARLESASREPQRDAALLLCRVLGEDRAWLWTHPDVPLTPAQALRYRTLVERRAMSEPMQYILGEQEFYGLAFTVSPAVLIPRPETELLVDSVLARVDRDQPLQIVDVGTGSGIIAVALAQMLPKSSITAVDLSPQALVIARGNAARHRVTEQVRFLESDLLRAVEDERFDVVVSNPPYVATGEVLERQVQEYEPAEALFAGPCGLEIYERLIPQAEAALNPGGWLLLEIGLGQRQAVASMLTGWQDLDVEKDLQGIERVISARRWSDSPA